MLKKYFQGVKMKKLSVYLIVCGLILAVISACSSSDDDIVVQSVGPKITGTQLIANPGSGKVTLDWTMVKDAETYNIYYIPDAQNQYDSNNPPSDDVMRKGTKITGLLSAIEEITSLSNGTKYWFAVTAVNSNGESKNLSAKVSATPNDPAPPFAPENVRANGGDAKITVTWDVVTGATSYNIGYGKLDSNLNFTPQDIDNVGVCDSKKCRYVISAPDHPIENATPTTLIGYGVFVTAVGSGSGLESSPSFADFTIPSTTPPPFAPVFDTAEYGSFSINSTTYNVHLKWKASETTDPAITGYNIYIGKAKNVTVATGALTSVADQLESYTNLTSGKYYIVITAVNSHGQSTESNELSVTIP